MAEAEVEICRSDEDPESDLHRRQEECNFIPEPEFTIEHLPVESNDDRIKAQKAGSSLDDDIEKSRKESEVEICRSDGDLESDLHRRQEECNFIPEPEFTIEHLPVESNDDRIKAQKAGSLLDDDIEKSRKESEVEICRSDGDLESDLHQRQEECKKNPGHVDFIPEPEFTIEHLPVEWRDPWVYKKIRTIAPRVVLLSVKYTSHDRPDGYIFSEYRGTRLIRCGTGFVRFPHDFRNKPLQQCPFKNCKVPHPHNVTPEFYVDTASHVVFDSSEAEQTEIRFFFDSEDDTKDKAKVTAQGLRCVVSSGEIGERCQFTCVSHNLNIRDLCSSDTEEGELEPTPNPFDKEEKKPEPQFRPTGTYEEIPEQPLGPPLTEEKTHDPPLSPIEEERPESPIRDTNSKKRKPLVVIVSHPHGCSKHVSTGYWTGVKPTHFSFLNSFKNMTLRNFTDLMREAGCQPELLKFLDQTPDKTLGQLYQGYNIDFIDFVSSFTHDMAQMLTCTFTFNEIAYKVLLEMWEKTCESPLSEQVSEEKLTEIGLSVVTDILPIESSELKEMISLFSLKIWRKLTSDSTFNRQLCREEVSEICKRVVNDTLGTNSLTLEEIFRKMCSLLSIPVDTFVTLVPKSSLFNESSGIKDEANPSRKMAEGPAFERNVDEDSKKPNFVENHFERMLYSTMTCQGSSGAPVLLFYDEGKGQTFCEVSTHCAGIKRANMSCQAPFICSLFEKVNATDELKQEVSQDDIKPTDKLNQESSQDDIKPTDELKQEASQDDIKPTDELKQEASQDDIKPTDKLNQESSQDDIKPTDELKQEVSQDDIKPTDELKQESSQDDIKPTDELNQESSQDDIKPTDELKQEVSQDDTPLD